jgi:hypothetical protein
MSTTNGAARSLPTSPARQLEAAFAAVRVSFTWLGVRKTLTPDQKAQAAIPFGAEGRYLSAAKRMLDISDPRFRSVTSIRGRIVSFWKGMSVPYPDPGIRLIRQNQIETFDSTIQELAEELTEAVGQLDDNYESLKTSAQERLGSLFNAADYPPSLRGLFECSWEFPSVEPPDYLRRLNPELFEQEKKRMTARFEEAARLAEEAFVGEFSKLVGHLVERITSSGAAGEKKVFRDSAVESLKEFFDRFRMLNIHSNSQLDELVETAQQAVAGISPQELRDSEGLRRQMSSQMAGVLSALDGLLVDAPRRKLLRTKNAGAQEGG